MEEKSPFNNKVSENVLFAEKRDGTDLFPFEREKKGWG